MMSAALLMLAGVEQTGKSAGSADSSVDQSKQEGMSFAKSFNDRVGESTLLQEASSGSSAKNASIGLLPGSKVSIPAKKLDVDVAVASEGKELTHAVQDTPAHWKVKNVAGSLDDAAQVVVAGSVAKAAENGSAAKNVATAVSVEGSETTENVSSGSSVSSVIPIVLQPQENVVVSAVRTDESQSYVSSASSAFAQKETESAGKTKEISSARKTAKISETTSTSKTVQKAVKADGNVIEKHGDASSSDDAGTVTQAIVAGVGAPPKDDVSTNGNRLSEAIAGKTLVSSGVSSATAGGAVHEETVPETKASADTVDTGTAMSSADGQPALQKFGGELEKAASVAAVTGSGGDGKMQSASGPGMLTVHPATGGMAPGVATLAVVSGNSQGETASTKPHPR